MLCNATKSDIYVIACTKNALNNVFLTICSTLSCLGSCQLTPSALIIANRLPVTRYLWPVIDEPLLLTRCFSLFLFGMSSIMRTLK